MGDVVDLFKRPDIESILVCDACDGEDFNLFELKDGLGFIQACANQECVKILGVAHIEPLNLDA